MVWPGRSKRAAKNKIELVPMSLGFRAPGRAAELSSTCPKVRSFAKSNRGRLPASAFFELKRDKIAKDEAPRRPFVVQGSLSAEPVGPAQTVGQPFLEAAPYRARRRRRARYGAAEPQQFAKSPVTASQVFQMDFEVSLASRRRRSPGLWRPIT
jgi:hypothetical protein